MRWQIIPEYTIGNEFRTKFLNSMLGRPQISLLLIIFTTFCDAFKESGNGGGGDSEDDSPGRLIRVVVLGESVYMLVRH